MPGSLFLPILWLSRYGRPQHETEKYIEKCAVPEEKFDLFMVLEQWKKAADVAIKLRDPNRLMEVNKPFYCLQLT
jgi:hypothetical protein